MVRFRIFDKISKEKGLISKNFRQKNKVFPLVVDKRAVQDNIQEKGHEEKVCTENKEGFKIKINEEDYKDNEVHDAKLEVVRSFEI